MVAYTPVKSLVFQRCGSRSIIGLLKSVGLCDHSPSMRPRSLQMLSSLILWIPFFDKKNKSEDRLRMVGGVLYVEECEHTHLY